VMVMILEVNCSIIMKHTKIDTLIDSGSQSNLISN
jgi:hypothetical protein